MFILIYEEKIAGSSDTSDNLPEGFQAIEYEFTSLDVLYYDDGSIKTKPAKPGDNYIWVDKAWVKMPEAEGVKPDTPFSQTELFSKARVAGRESLAVQMEFTVAVYADSQGNKQLLEDAKQQLAKSIKAHEEQKKKAASTSSVTTGVKL